MQSSTNRFHVLTGGPGAGKTTLIDALAGDGFGRSEEAGRGVIQHQAAIRGNALPWSDPALFAEAMLVWEMRSHHIASGQPGTVLFDRGVPDVLGYLRLSGIAVPGHVERAAEQFRYNRTVCVLPPWRQIFRQDDERKQDFDEAERTFEAVTQAYRDCDYQLIEVPRGPLDERRRFLLAHLGG